MTNSHDAIPSSLDATSPTVRADEDGVRSGSSGTKPLDGERAADWSRSAMRSAASTRCMARACPPRHSRPSHSSRLSRRVRTACLSATSRRQARSSISHGLGHRKRSCTPGGRRRTTSPYPAVERMGRAHSHRSRARPLRRGGLRQCNRPPGPSHVADAPRFVWRVASSRVQKHVARGKDPAGDRDPSTVSAMSHTVHLRRALSPPLPGSCLRPRSLGVAEDDLKCALELCRRAEFDDLGAGV
jgi:hypothetical protein